MPVLVFSSIFSIALYYSSVFVKMFSPNMKKFKTLALMENQGNPKLILEKISKGLKLSQKTKLNIKCEQNI
jgi:hypothetical protein